MKTAIKINKQMPQKKRVKSIQPVDFEFDIHRGKIITIKTTEGTQTGVLLGLVEDIVKLILRSKTGFPGLSQIDYSEIQHIILN